VPEAWACLRERAWDISVGVGRDYTVGARSKERVGVTRNRASVLDWLVVLPARQFIALTEEPNAHLAITRNQMTYQYLPPGLIIDFRPEWK
jgi:hypothetical protein